MVFLICIQASFLFLLENALIRLWPGLVAKVDGAEDPTAFSPDPSLLFPCSSQTPQPSLLTPTHRAQQH